MIYNNLSVACVLILHQVFLKLSKVISRKNQSKCHNTPLCNNCDKNLMPNTWFLQEKTIFQAVGILELVIKILSTAIQASLNRPMKGIEWHIIIIFKLFLSSKYPVALLFVIEKATICWVIQIIVVAMLMKPAPRFTKTYTTFKANKDHCNHYEVDATHNPEIIAAFIKFPCSSFINLEPHLKYCSQNKDEAAKNLYGEMYLYLKGDVWILTKINALALNRLWLAKLNWISI